MRGSWQGWSSDGSCEIDGRLKWLKKEYNHVHLENRIKSKISFRASRFLVIVPVVFKTLSMLEGAFQQVPYDDM